MVTKYLLLNINLVLIIQNPEYLSSVEGCITYKVFLPNMHVCNGILKNARWLGKSDSLLSYCRLTCKYAFYGIKTKRERGI